jgi:hypothetical protein
MTPAVIPRVFLNQLEFAMWTPTIRMQHGRPVTRYQIDLTNAEWRVIAPHQKLQSSPLLRRWFPWRFLSQFGPLMRSARLA